jgi:hypothetical protein
MVIYDGKLFDVPYFAEGKTERGGDGHGQLGMWRSRERGLAP